MKTLIFSVLGISVSLSAFATPKESIYGADALQIVAALQGLNVQGMREGSSDEGLVNLKSYSFLGMTCITGNSHYGGYGSKLEGACHFDDVRSQDELAKIRKILATAGLDKKNSLFK